MGLEPHIGSKKGGAFASLSDAHWKPLLQPSPATLFGQAITPFLFCCFQSFSYLQHNPPFCFLVLWYFFFDFRVVLRLFCLYRRVFLRRFLYLRVFPIYIYILLL